MLAGSSWRAWWDASSAYDEAPPLAAWIVMAPCTLAGIIELAEDRAGLVRALLHPLVVGALVVAVALVVRWIRGGAWRLCLLVLGDLVASTGAAINGAAWDADTYALRESAATFAVAAVTLVLFPGVFLHLRAWAMLTDAWGTHRYSSRSAAEVKAVLHGPPSGRDVVFVVTSVADGDAEGEIRDGSGSRPGVIRADLLDARLASDPPRVPASFLLGGVTMVEERVPADGYRSQTRRTRVTAAAASRWLGRDPENATESVSFVPEMIVAVVVLIAQHVVLGLLAAPLALALGW